MATPIPDGQTELEDFAEKLGPQPDDFIVTVTRDGQVLARIDIPKEAIDDPVRALGRDISLAALRAAVVLLQAGLVR